MMLVVENSLMWGIWKEGDGLRGKGTDGLWVGMRDGCVGRGAVEGCGADTAFLG